MKALRNIWPAYLTGFALACAAMVGFILGIIVHNSMAVASIHQLEESIKTAIVERGV